MTFKVKKKNKKNNAKTLNYFYQKFFYFSKLFINNFLICNLIGAYYCITNR